MKRNITPAFTAIPRMDRREILIPSKKVSKRGLRVVLEPFCNVLPSRFYWKECNMVGSNIIHLNLRTFRQTLESTDLF